MSEFTEILSAIESGDANAADELLPLIYDELRKLAAVHLAGEQPGQTLQPTALVHEVYLRLLGGENLPRWENQSHFFACAAISIRRILIEKARRKQTLKRGKRILRIPLDEAIISAPQPLEDLIELNEALEKLAVAHAQAAELVQLRYFAGLSIPQAASALDVSPRTADRLWTYARAWLRRELQDNSSTDEA